MPLNNAEAKKLQKLLTNYDSTQNQQKVSPSSVDNKEKEYLKEQYVFYSNGSC